ncbi:hypothetical protein [Streptomyces sp. RFCAC02]|uniref:hypothetical protein n=1 Tax=Streptomyces sp. RFCAC02 TaxID=2499143 RepID=UPI00101E9D72|nr:hypothetical protein [Streptomyces sp. RFCAC02]
MYTHLRAAAVTGVALLGLTVLPAERSAGSGALPEPRLRAALLDTMDFPEGWAGDSARSAAERGFGVPEPSERDCRGLFDSAEETTARAGFARTESGPFVTTVLAAHESAAAARAALDAFDDTAERCRTFHTREGPGGGAATVSYHAAELDVGRLGEESTAVRFERRVDGPAHGAPVVADVVIARVGAQVVRVAQAGRADRGAGDLAAMADRAVEKLEQVADGQDPLPPAGQPGTTDL